ncbi:hypothetical protein [Phytohabitans rumicis]|uniref:Uncharacterized protein n=1 Tax=Phytohabitans rumicis TaxID=1076125 RepID=A0A6V8L1Q8_9ACTN|nr:hypothetical protein [Phytohabitans rumicis]GFJ90074.1 hypothetical protein Prum_037160 [Phytohabitans rumicis]
MDALDQLAAASAGLLDRVDGILTEAGAPADHRIWALLRRLGAMPADAVGTVVALRPAPLAAAGPPLRTLIQEYDEARAAIADGGSWEGAGAEVFAVHRSALSTHLGGLTARLAATQAYTEAVADWATQSRRSLARELAAVLGSTEAVTVTTEPVGPAAAVAAAEIGARLLGAVDAAYERVEALLSGWATELGELSYQAPDAGPTPFDLTTRIGH